jgi:hypothetical protein
VGKQQRLTIPDGVRKALSWPNELPKTLLVQVHGGGVLELLGPAAVRDKEEEWRALELRGEEGLNELVSDQRRHYSVRFEKVGFRMYLTQELLYVLQLSLKSNPATRVLVQATAEDNVWIMTRAGYLAWLDSD